MRLLVLAAMGVICTPCLSQAHQPDRANQHVHPRVDVIGPIGNRLPVSHRRQYNRPTNLGGRIAYWIAPSSQEAMAWHAAQNRGDYRCNRPRAEERYFHAKPYEMLAIGARHPRKSTQEDHQNDIAVKPKGVDIKEMETEEFNDDDSDVKMSSPALAPSSK